jgi:RimJ/RimL family protein N-acetyltransferase
VIRVEPTILSGELVRLEPLSPNHIDQLWDVAQDAELWRLTVSKVRTRDDLRRYVETALAEQARGVALPFATIARAAGRAVGSTRFANIAPEHRRVEIGWTWLGRPWQRSGVNTEAKLLMLRHAFEAWQCVRVEFKTSTLNRQSRDAILRLGAVEEGILRRHTINQDGTIRDTVYYSILDDEWPAVRARLEARLAGAALARRAPSRYFPKEEEAQ